jgi:alanine-synthesizing transaminase
MFSNRLHWDLRPNRLSQVLAEMRRRGTHLLDLTESNPTHAALEYPADEILDALADVRALRYDPSPAGLPAARDAIAAWYAARGQNVRSDRIVLTASTSEAYAYLFKLLANPGDEVLVPRPSYPLFEYLAALESVKVVQYPLVYDHGWSVDFEALEQLCSERARAIVVVNPNNPTGSFLKQPELDRLTGLCAARDLAIISDEVFAGFAFEPGNHRVSSLTGVTDAATFCMSGLSKISALPQMKLGWIVTAGPDEIRTAAMERLELISDTFLSAGTPVQYAAARLLEIGANLEQQIRRRTAVNLAHLRAAAVGSPCGVLELEGGWYATLRVPRTRGEEEWCLELLEHHQTIVQPGFFYDFDMEAFLVLSLLTEPPVFRDGVSRVISAASA